MSGKSNLLKTGLPAVLLGACVTWFGINWDRLGIFSSSSERVEIPVYFDESGCPSMVGENQSTPVKPGKRLTFISDPLKTGNVFNEFNLSIGPFTTVRYNSKNGKLKSYKKIDKRATPKKDNGNGRFKPGQDFKYKYTINATNCDPVDPIVIIDY